MSIFLAIAMAVASLFGSVSPTPAGDGGGPGGHAVVHPACAGDGGGPGGGCL